VRNSDDVKDKNIRMEGIGFRSQVEYYNGKIINCGLHDSLLRAQRSLDRYPRDVWDGYDCTDYRYREPSIKRRKRTSSSPPPRLRRLFLSGRTLAGLK
jgi:hypothetical protein